MNTAAGADPSVFRVTAALEAHGRAMEGALWQEMARLAQEAARRMRDLAPKWRSQLVNSISVSQPAPNTWEVRPGVAHGLFREKGQRPGKHLPMFGTPAAKGITEWLQSKAFKNLAVGPSPFARLRKNDRRRSVMEEQLRDRYMGLSWHVKRKGLRAQPFVEPVALVMERTVPQRMAAVVQRMVQQANGSAA
jgi:hypothetical protein